MALHVLIIQINKNLAIELLESGFHSKIGKEESNVLSLSTRYLSTPPESILNW